MEWRGMLLGIGLAVAQRPWPVEPPWPAALSVPGRALEAAPAACRCAACWVLPPREGCAANASARVYSGCAAVDGCEETGPVCVTDPGCDIWVMSCTDEDEGPEPETACTAETAVSTTHDWWHAGCAAACPGELAGPMELLAQRSAVAGASDPAARVDAACAMELGCAIDHAGCFAPGADCANHMTTPSPAEWSSACTSLVHVLGVAMPWGLTTRDSGGPHHAPLFGARFRECFCDRCAEHRAAHFDAAGDDLFPDPARSDFCDSNASTCCFATQCHASVMGDWSDLAHAVGAKCETPCDVESAAAAIALAALLLT